MVIANLILEEKNRLEHLVPIYDGKIAGCVDDIQREYYADMKYIINENLKELEPFVKLAEEINNGRCT